MREFRFFCGKNRKSFADTNNFLYLCALIARLYTRIGAPMEVIENQQELEDEDEIYESIEDLWPDYPTKEDFFFDEEEY